MQQSTSKHPRLQAFVSLSWYAGLISFLFRFLAMTSEPLLALGVILSAADFLQQGHLMAHNAALQAAWSWAQAISIEASTGPTLAFSLDAFRAGDKIKGRLYATLAALLFIVGGCMLYLQLISNATGMSEAAVSPWVLYPLLALRVLVASGIVALLCSKHLRFSGLVTDSATAQPAPTMNLKEVIDELDSRLQHRIEGVYQRIDFKISEAIGISQELPAVRLLPPPATDKAVMTREFLTRYPGATDEALAAHLGIDRPAAAHFWRLKVQEPGEPVRGVHSQEEMEPAGEAVQGGQNGASYGNQIEAMYRAHPTMTTREIAEKVGCSPTTVSKWLKRLEVPRQADDTRGVV